MINAFRPVRMIKDNLLLLLLFVVSEFVEKRMFTISKRRNRERIKGEIVSCVLFSFHLLKEQIQKLNIEQEGGEEEEEKKERSSDRNK